MLVIENKIQVEATRSILHVKNLPEYLWAKAVRHSSAIPVKGNNHLIIFGTEGFFHPPKQKRNEFQKQG